MPYGTATTAVPRARPCLRRTARALHRARRRAGRDQRHRAGIRVRRATARRTPQVGSGRRAAATRPRLHGARGLRARHDRGGERCPASDGLRERISKRCSTRYASSLGDGVQIVAANRVRKGGVGGFFREYFEVVAEEPEAPIDLRPPVRLGRHRREPESTPVDLSRSVPRSVLDLVEERNEEERRFGALDLGSGDLGAADTAHHFDDVRDLHSMDRGELYVDDHGVFRASEGAERRPAREADWPGEARTTNREGAERRPTTKPIGRERERPMERITHAHGRTAAISQSTRCRPCRPGRLCRLRPHRTTSATWPCRRGTNRTSSSSRRATTRTNNSHRRPCRPRPNARADPRAPGAQHRAPQCAGGARRRPHRPHRCGCRASRTGVVDRATARTSTSGAEPPAMVSLVDVERRAATAAAPIAPMAAAAAAPPHWRRRSSARRATAPKRRSNGPSRVSCGSASPQRFVPRGMAGNALHRDALTESLTRLPHAATLPSTKGVVVAIVGMGARRCCSAAPYRRSSVSTPKRWSSRHQSEIDGVPAWLQITDPEAADERRRSWRRRDHLAFVAISQPALTTATTWASDMLDRLEPTQLWGLRVGRLEARGR